ncbi:MAG: tRNA guanosine(34) transglycosylase Tgt [Candidatus Dadabacteria bacterium]|nr:MAG: tRNA guanosine(34) transglycosylase Tgt [Candidatus Dadabacteria bacterium]
MKEGKFRILAEDGNARCGVYATSSGEFDTPNFMPVGTRGSVKGVDCERLEEIGTQIVLVNTYHLWIRPGVEHVKALGGIHKFTGWNGPILSDSGGFQIYSLSSLRKITEEGVEFRSHLDGAKKFLSPELAVSLQEDLGVDIAMALDECPPADLSYGEVERSLNLTLRWASRSLKAKTKDTMSLFGITQGGCYKDLRARSAEEICAMDFDGVAVGGLSVGEPKDVMYEVLDYHVPDLCPRRVRYLMGVGTPRDIVEAVRHGIDLFDCVIPTRSGRFGRAFISGEEPYINIKNSRHAKADMPLDEGCLCLSCRRYSRGYIHHLFKSGEMLGPQLVTIHNLAHYMGLMASIREAVKAGQFGALYRKIRMRYKGVDIEEGCNDKKGGDKEEV